MIKSQQQRIGDLRKTLQKELKVQSLPNDEPVHGNSSIMHPMDSVGDSPAARAALSGGTALVHDHHASQPAALPVSSSQIHNLSRTTTSTVKSGLHPRQCDNSVGLAPLDRLVVPKGKGGFPQYSTSSLSFTINENADGDDINLPYVKHVVLKFILSRESEVRLSTFLGFLSFGFFFLNKHELMTQCWASVIDDVPTLAQHWADASCLLGYFGEKC